MPKKRAPHFSYFLAAPFFLLFGLLLYFLLPTFGLNGRPGFITFTGLSILYIILGLILLRKKKKQQTT